jgi:phage terminase small subunit
VHFGLSGLFMGTKLIQPSKRGANIERLTAQQRVFVEELLNDPKFKPTDAAKKAGYKAPSQAANKLMNDKVVAAYIGKELYLRSQRNQVTADEVLRALTDIAFFNIQSILEDDGTIKNIADIEEHMAFAIESIETTTRTDRNGDVTTQTKLKFHSKIAALELLAKHLGMLQERFKVEHSGSVDIVAQILGEVESRKSVIDAESIRIEADKT